jgi:D-beta-D-heptose 7-phosphate kinase/D-beta-D-heptose 1-phosphate adenosyltransferase
MSIEMSGQQPKKFNILLIGDDCLDVYQYGLVDRLSPEAPVPIFKILEEKCLPGMAGNVYRNLINLGCNVQYLHNLTSKKIRIIDKKSGQHLLRIDDDMVSEPITFETAIPPSYDAIVISDYNKGTVSYELIEEMIDTGIPVFVDTKKTDLSRFNGAIVKINSIEYANAKSLPINLIVTMGANGVTWDGRKYDVPLIDVVDVCGAGDTFLASFVYDYLQTNNIDNSIKFAIKSASITVQHTGVYAPTLGEINAFAR